MTDTMILSELQSQAVTILLEETFSLIHEEARESYAELGKRNAVLQGTKGIYFIHGGTVYPLMVDNIPPRGSYYPILHYSLLSELDTINKALAQSDFHYIKNFLVAVVSQSHNSIVLDALLPTVLVNKLKEAFYSEDYKTLDSGVYGDLKQEPISVTHQNIQAIKDHYQSAIATLKYLAIERFLLQK